MFSGKSRMTFSNPKLKKCNNLDYTLTGSKLHNENCSKCKEYSYEFSHIDPKKHFLSIFRAMYKSEGF